MPPSISKVKNPSQVLYQKLRRLPWRELWEIRRPRFDSAPSAERLGDSALVRAIGVVLSESAPPPARAAAIPWLRSLLDDPQEKIRRYAINALVKNRAAEPGDILPRLHGTTSPSEQKALTASLEKIAPASLPHPVPLPAATRQKLAAAAARASSPSRILLDAALPEASRIHLRCRRGLERHLGDEVASLALLRPANVLPGLVTATSADGSPTLRGILKHRTFATLGVFLGTASDNDGIADIIASPASLGVLRTLTDGPIRYRLEFTSRGHQRGAIRSIAMRAYSIAPALLNDPREATWAIDLHSMPDKRISVELRPRLSPDPRFLHRVADVPASSHPPLAAVIARLAASPTDSVVWDPFCGSGLELIERALLGGVRQLIGSDLSPVAADAARANIQAARLPVQPTILSADFRDVPAMLGLSPASLDAIVTNPPLGRRVPVPQLRALIADLLDLASRLLRKRGLLVLANPLPDIATPGNLERTLSHPIDMGGFTCHLQRFRKK